MSSVNKCINLYKTKYRHSNTVTTNRVRDGISVSACTRFLFNRIVYGVGAGARWISQYIGNFIGTSETLIDRVGEGDLFIIIGTTADRVGEGILFIAWVPRQAQRQSSEE